MSLRVLLLTLSLIAVSLAELVNYQLCDQTPPGEKPNCTIHSVTVNPCPQAATGEPCKLKRGKTASILFDFTPEFSGKKDSVKNRAYWKTPFADFPFAGIDSNACTYVNCPLTAGEVNHYNYTLNIDKSYPASTYDVKWKVWDEEDKTNHQCCFVFKIRLY